MYLEHIKIYMQGNTITLYNMALHYLKLLNNMEISKIATIHLQKCIVVIIRKELAYSTVKTYKNRITVIFNSAVDKYNIISVSPASKLELYF